MCKDFEAFCYSLASGSQFVPESWFLNTLNVLACKSTIPQKHSIVYSIKIWRLHQLGKRCSKFSFIQILNTFVIQTTALRLGKLCLMQFFIISEFMVFKLFEKHSSSLWNFFYEPSNV